jgi:hypothetical protein
MKLMKLLSVGRSFNGGKRMSGDYKLQQSLLPKFSSSVRPSKAAVAARLAGRPIAKSQPQSEVPSHVQEQPQTALVESSIAEMPEKTQKIPAGKILQRVPEREAVQAEPKADSWMQKRMAALKKRWFPPRSRKRAGAVPTQTEWALENLAVARNDLNDADLEIVARKAAPKNKTHFADLTRVKISGVAWFKKTTTRMFRTTSPFQAPAVKAQTKERELAERH